MQTAEFASPEKRRSALRLIDTKSLAREEWLEVRRQGIGSSDAAAAVGLNPYKSPLMLWMEKTGRDHLLPAIDVKDDTLPIFWGNLLEPIVAAQYSRRTGHRVRKINAVLQHPDPELGWMLANIDREVVGAEGVQILECKTAGINGARSWADGVPEYVQLQVQHQLAVTGNQAADVAVLIGGQKLEVHRIERDDVLIGRLIRLERNFWRYVETDTPPPAGATDSCELALRSLFPADAGSTVDFSEDRELSAKFADLQALREKIEALQPLERTLKHAIQQAMGEASIALFETGRVSWKKAKDSRVLDVEKLLQAHPDLLEQYPLVRSGSRRFLIS